METEGYIWLVTPLSNLTAPFCSPFYTPKIRPRYYPLQFVYKMMMKTANVLARKASASARCASAMPYTPEGEKRKTTKLREMFYKKDLDFLMEAHNGTSELLFWRRRSFEHVMPQQKLKLSPPQDCLRRSSKKLASRASGPAASTLVFE